MSEYVHDINIILSSAHCFGLVLRHRAHAVDVGEVEVDAQPLSRLAARGLDVDVVGVDVGAFLTKCEHTRPAVGILND